MKKTAATRAPAKPFLRFHHSQQLRKRSDEVVAALERDEDPTRHAEKLAALVGDLTHTGMNYFFIEPLKAAKAGFLVEQTASFGMSSALMVITPVIRNVICRMSGEQLLVVADHLRRFAK
jgi:hypothetical protein